MGSDQRATAQDAEVMADGAPDQASQVARELVAVAPALGESEKKS